MLTYITITSKRQATFPKKLLDKLGVKKGDKIIAKVKNNQVILEPAVDIMNLAGILGSNALRKNIKTVIQTEKDAIANAVSEDYKRKFVTKK